MERTLERTLEVFQKAEKLLNVVKLPPTSNGTHPLCTYEEFSKTLNMNDIENAGQDTKIAMNKIRAYFAYLLVLACFCLLATFTFHMSSEAFWWTLMGLIAFLILCGQMSEGKMWARDVILGYLVLSVIIYGFSTWIAFIVYNVFFAIFFGMNCLLSVFFFVLFIERGHVYRYVKYHQKQVVRNR